MVNAENFEKILEKMFSLEIFTLFNKNDENDRRIFSLIYEYLTEQDFKEGEIIIEEGEIGEDFYILLQGKVQIIRKTQSGDPIAIANLDDSMNISFGEAALIGNDTRSATVKALSDCKTLKLSGQTFIDLCDCEPVLGYKILLQLAKRMKSTLAKANNDIATLYEALFREIEGEN